MRTRGPGVRTRRVTSPLLLLLAALAAPALPAAAAPASLEGRAAPAWRLTRWAGTPRAIEPADLEGRVVLLGVVDAATRAGLEAFTEAVRAQRRGPDGPAAVLVLRAYPRAARDLEAEAERLAAALGIPVAAGTSPVFLQGYGAAAPPRAYVLDRRGVVRFAGPMPPATRLRLLVDALDAAGRRTNPLVGQRFGDTSGLRFVGTNAPAFDRRALTLVRWWTMHCPHCRASVPALADVVGRHDADAIALLPVYHYKGGPRPDVETLRRTLAAYGHEGPFAIDPGWQKLRDLMRRAGFSRATSVSFLVDREGRVLWAHPGPRVHDSDDLRHADADADLRALAALVDAHLAAREDD